MATPGHVPSSGYKPIVAVILKPPDHRSAKDGKHRAYPLIRGDCSQSSEPQWPGQRGICSQAAMVVGFKLRLPRPPALPQCQVGCPGLVTPSTWSAGRRVQMPEVWGLSMPPFRIWRRRREASGVSSRARVPPRIFRDLFNNSGLS